MLARWLCCRGQEKTGLTKEAQASRRGTEPETAMQETHPGQELRCRKQKNCNAVFKAALAVFLNCACIFLKTALAVFETALAVLKTALQFVDVHCKITCVSDTYAPNSGCIF